jgi:hypothetical protein
MSILKIKDSRGKQTLHPFEHATDLYSIAHYIGPSGDNIGALILRQGKTFIVRFGWILKGVHADISISQAVATVESLRQLCKEIPERESLKIEWSCFADFADRDAELVELYSEASTEIQALITADRRKLRELSSSNKKGVRVRKPTSLIIWASYSMHAENLELDLLEKGLLFATTQIKKLSGEEQINLKQKYDTFLLSSYKNGFQTWARLFETRLPGEARPMNPSEVWERGCWLKQNRFSNYQAAKCPSIPHLTTINTFDKAVDEELNGNHNIRSVLSFGNNALPIASRDSIYLDKKHITVLALQSEPADGEYEEAEQINILAELMPQLWDTEIIVQITKPSQDGARRNIQETRDDAVSRAATVARDGGVSVVAEDDAVDLIEAERQLMRNSAIVKFGLCILVYRDTQYDSRFAAEKVSNYFQSPAKCSIETEVAYPLWLHSLPYSASPLMGGIFSRQLNTSSDWAPSYMPLWSSVSRAKNGVEFTAVYGGSPVYFDLENERGHFLILGYTGCGKSLLAGYLCTAALAQGRFVTIIDTPTDKKASTFQDYAALVGGSYLDILDENTCYNFFQTPDLDRNDPDYGEYLEDYHSSLLNVLQAMVFGDPSTPFDGVVAARYNSILTKALREFFGSIEIQLAYESAKKAGMGSPEWELMPTLKTFLDYLTPNRLHLTIDAEREALSSVHGALERWVWGKFGKAISQPSRISIREKPLVVLALRDISNPADAVVWSAITDSILATRAIINRKKGSLAFLDEANVKFSYPAFAQSFATLCSIARKANMIVGAAAQYPGILDPESGDKVGKQILANIRYTFIGYIVPHLIQSYARVSSLEDEMFDPLCSQSFAPNYAEAHSKWLMVDQGHSNYVSCYLSDLLASILSNEQKQREARNSLIEGLSPQKALEVLYTKTKS